MSKQFESYEPLPNQEFTETRLEVARDRYGAGHVKKAEALKKLLGNNFVSDTHTAEKTGEAASGCPSSTSRGAPKDSAEQTGELATRLESSTSQSATPTDGSGELIFSGLPLPLQVAPSETAEKTGECASSDQTSTLQVTASDCTEETGETASSSSSQPSTLQVPFTDAVRQTGNSAATGETPTLQASPSAGNGISAPDRPTKESAEGLLANATSVSDDLASNHEDETCTTIEYVTSTNAQVDHGNSPDR